MSSGRLMKLLSRPGRSLLWAFLAFGVALLLSLKYSGPLGPARSPDRQVQVVHLVADPECNPSVRTCRAARQGYSVGLAFAHPPQALEPFGVDVRVAGLVADDIERVEVEFVMSGMNMGMNRYRLDSTGHRLWQGRATLPVCTTGRSDWIAIVRVLSGENEYVARFPFVTA